MEFIDNKTIEDFSRDGAVLCKGMFVDWLDELRIGVDKLIENPSVRERSYTPDDGTAPFFQDLVSFITSGPVVAMQVEGEDVVSEVRRIMGATNPSDADAGTIRADFATKLEENVVHGSDSEESAERELSLFFNN